MQDNAQLKSQAMPEHRAVSQRQNGSLQILPICRFKNQTLNIKVFFLYLLKYTPLQNVWLIEQFIKHIQAYNTKFLQYKRNFF